MKWTVVAIWSALVPLVLINQGDPIWPIWSANPVVGLVWLTGFFAVLTIFGRLQATGAKRQAKLESEAAGRVPVELLGEEETAEIEDAAYGCVDDAALAEVIRILEQFLQGEASAKELRHNLEELCTSLQDPWVHSLTHPIGQDLAFSNFWQADSRRRFCDLLNRTRLALTARLPLYYRAESSRIAWVAFTAIGAQTIFLASLIGFGLSLPFALAWLLNALTILAIARHHRAAGRIYRKTLPWMPFESEEEFQEVLAEHPSFEMLACDTELAANRQHWSTANWGRHSIREAIWALFSPLALLFALWLPVTRIYGISRVRLGPERSAQETEKVEEEVVKSRRWLVAVLSLLLVAALASLGFVLLLRRAGSAMQEANASFAKGDYDAAIASYSEAIRLLPKFMAYAAYSSRGGAYSNRGFAYNNQGDLDKAIADSTEAIRIKPRLAEAYSNRGFAYNNQGDLDKAIADCTEAIRIKPRLAMAYNNRALAYNNKREWDKAIADYTEVIRLDPKLAYAYANRGFAYRGKGDQDHAIADYTAAIQLDPTEAVAYRHRGNAYRDRGDLDEAIKDYTNAIRLNPKDAVAYNQRGLAHLDKDDFDKAIADYTEAIRLNPKDIWAYCNRGLAYTDKGDLDQAIADYTEAIRLNPTLAIAYKARGVAYEQKGEKAKATEDLAQARKLGYKKEETAIRALLRLLFPAKNKGF